MSKALSPQEAIVRFKSEVPEPVMEAWNNLIVENLKVQGGKATSGFTLEALASKITTAMNVSRDTAKDRGWFDLEDIFRDKGWKVEFDSPAYNESYTASYKFRGA